MFSASRDLENSRNIKYAKIVPNMRQPIFQIFRVSNTAPTLRQKYAGRPLRGLLAYFWRNSGKLLHLKSRLAQFLRTGVFF
jgi:hypothetical protein